MGHMNRLSLVRYGWGSRRGDQVLHSQTRYCMFCQADTAHDTVRHMVEDRYGPSKKQPRTIEVCQRCRGYRIIRLSDEQQLPDAAQQ